MFFLKLMKDLDRIPHKQQKVFALSLLIHNYRELIKVLKSDRNFIESLGVAIEELDTLLEVKSSLDDRP